MRTIKAGIIGCGNVSPMYFRSAATMIGYTITAVADLDLERARQRAEEFAIPRFCSAKELLADPEIEVVINLTIPAVHAEVSIQALEAGKHVYVEKPLARTREEAKQVLAVAKAKGLLIGSAPDTFLGAGIQTCIKLIQDGWIGTPVGASATMIWKGHEGWHPNPDFFYQKGGGPLLDMGPYYLTALVAMLGPIAKVNGMARSTYPERTITSKARYGEKIPVDTPTHITGLLQFESGVLGTITTSFDVGGGTQTPRIEVYGSQGTLIVPDPNTFGGPVKLRRSYEGEFIDMPLTHDYSDNSRGLGVLDMVYALRGERPHRASGELAAHVLDAMYGILDSAESGEHYTLEQRCAGPKPFPTGMVRGMLD